MKQILADLHFIESKCGLDTGRGHPVCDGAGFLCGVWGGKDKFPYSLFVVWEKSKE